MCDSILKAGVNSNDIVKNLPTLCTSSLLKEHDRALCEVITSSHVHKVVPRAHCIILTRSCCAHSVVVVLVLADSASPHREADVKKDQGNRAFKESKFEEASALYTEAMALCPLSARPKHAVYYRCVCACT